MFGYVCPVDSMLGEEALSAFKASYCGVCRHMGMVSRFALSYECAFLALLYDGLTSMPPQERRACRAFPLRRKIMVSGNNQRYAADVNALLAYYKLRDDVLDEGGFKNRLLCALMKPAMLKAQKRLPKVASLIREQMDSIYRLESAECADIESISHEFATLLQGVGAPGFDREGALGRFFYDLGRWIYTVDALLDYESDNQAGRFNPLKTYADLAESRKAISFSLWHTLSQMEISLGVLNPQEPALSVCKHIIYDVLPTHTLRALGQDKGGRDSEPLSSAGR